MVRRMPLRRTALNVLLGVIEWICDPKPGQQLASIIDNILPRRIYPEHSTWMSFSQSNLGSSPSLRLSVDLYGLHRSGITSNSRVSRQQRDPLNQRLGYKNAIEWILVYRRQCINRHHMLTADRQFAISVIQ